MTGAWVFFLLIGLFKLFITVGLLIKVVTLFLKKDYLISTIEFIFSTPLWIRNNLPCIAEEDEKYLLH